MSSDECGLKSEKTVNDSSEIASMKVQNNTFYESSINLTNAIKCIFTDHEILRSLLSYKDVQIIESWFPETVKTWSFI